MVGVVGVWATGGTVVVGAEEDVPCKTVGGALAHPAIRAATASAVNEVRAVRAAPDGRVPLAWWAAGAEADTTRASAAVDFTARREIEINDNKGKLRQGRTDARGTLNRCDGVAGASTRNFTAIGASKTPIGSLFEGVINGR
ncbi:hypothetical protein THI4931_03470 [Pandoraea sputorum]|nr:hypothetical protein THI4931_03470 [Pandoraea sputorum]